MKYIKLRIIWKPIYIVDFNVLDACLEGTGSIITYTVEICNNSTQPLNGLYVEDVLDQRLIFQSSPDFTLSGPTLTSNLFNLAAMSCQTLTFDVKVDGLACDQISNCAELKAEDPADICPDVGCVDIMTINAQRKISGLASDPANAIPAGLTSIFIDGTLMINVPRYFMRNLNVTMGPNAKIVLPTGGNSTLYIEQTNIRSCDELGDGIYINGVDNLLVVSTNSLIEDAHQAVVSVNGGAYEITNSIFNANHRHVVVEPYQGAHSGDMNSCKLICDRTLLPPLAGQETFIGMDVNEVFSLQVGSDNYFDNMRYGIHIDRSSVVINRNKFKNIYAPGGPSLFAPSSAAIYARGIDMNVPPLANCNATIPTPAIMPLLDIENNHIENCQTGIDIKGHFNDLIRIDTIINIFSTAISVAADFSPIGNYITIEENRIENVKFIGIGVHDMDYSIVKIKNNDHIKDVNGIGIYLSTASWVNLIGAPHRCFLFEPEIIRNNKVENSAIGIYATNLYNVHITENEVLPLSTSLSGISTGNNTLLQVHYNEVTNAVQAQNQQIGINSVMNAGVKMSCNEVIKAGDAVRFEGQNFATEFIGNIMEQSNVGLHLMNGGPFVPVIGDQPPQSGGTLGWVNDNRWVGPSNSTHTNVTNSNPALTILSVRAGLPFQPINNSGIPNLIPNLITGNPPQNPCVNPGSLLRVASEIEDIASQSATTTEVELIQRQLYKLMMMSIVWQGDSLLTAFKDSCDQANIGKFAQVGKYVSQNHLPLAWLINEGIDPGPSYIDGHEKIVNRVWLEMKLAEESYPNENQRNLLNEIAEICVTEGGPAVLRARHILNKYQLATLIDSSGWQFFMDTCGTGNRLAEIQAETNKLQEEKWLLKAYPNPSGNSFQLEFEVDAADWTYELWSSTGQRVLTESLNSETTQRRITIPELAEGLYIGLWKRNGQTVKSHRQLIMK